MMNVSLEDFAFHVAYKLISHKVMKKDTDLFELTDLIVKLQKEKIEKQLLSDSLIDYNDEIVEIEDLGELDTIDISVSGDNLFYCNKILTKNSFSIGMTSDAIFALIATDELKELNQIMVKQIKNRFSDLNVCQRFVIGVDRSIFKLYDIDQEKMKDEAIMDATEFGQRFNLEEKMKSKFDSSRFMDLN